VDEVVMMINICGYGLPPRLRLIGKHLFYDKI
jgi:hypothetical protein